MMSANAVTSFVKSACLSLLMITGVAAQEYPSRPVTIVVPFATGGPTDTSARITAAALAKQTGGTFVVENIPGAATTIGATKASQAPADGYTLLWASNSITITPHLHPNLRYDPVRSFSSIGMVAEFPYVFAVSPSREYRNVADLIKAAKATSGGLNFSSAGIGSSAHLIAELFKAEAAIKAEHVPYKGGAPATIAVVAGEVDFTFDAPTTIVPLVRAGKLKPLAVTGKARLQDLPDVPTLTESGLSDVAVTGWMGLVTPAGTPPDVVAYLSKHLNAVLKQEDVVKGLNGAGFLVSPSSAEELTQRIANETTRWGEVVRKAEIKLK